MPTHLSTPQEKYVGMSNILDIDKFNRSFPVEWTHRILVGTAEMGSELVFEIVK